jgi:hypothetical protein
MSKLVNFPMKSLNKNLGFKLRSSKKKKKKKKKMVYRIEVKTNGGQVIRTTPSSIHLHQCHPLLQTLYAVICPNQLHFWKAKFNMNIITILLVSQPSLTLIHKHVYVHVHVNYFFYTLI